MTEKYISGYQDGNIHYNFVDKDIKNISSLMSEVPEELLDKIVKENVKKLGDFGGK